MLSNDALVTAFRGARTPSAVQAILDRCGPVDARIAWLAVCHGPVDAITPALLDLALGDPQNNAAVVARRMTLPPTLRGRVVTHLLARLTDERVRVRKAATEALQALYYADGIPADRDLVPPVFAMLARRLQRPAMAGEAGESLATAAAYVAVRQDLTDAELLALVDAIPCASSVWHDLASHPAATTAAWHRMLERHASLRLADILRRTPAAWRDPICLPHLAGFLGHDSVHALRNAVALSAELTLAGLFRCIGERNVEGAAHVYVALTPYERAEIPVEDLQYVLRSGVGEAKELALEALGADPSARARAATAAAPGLRRSRRHR